MTGWSEQDKIAFAKFGRKPKKSVLNLAGKERQHFDSADYEMNKGPGKTPAVVRIIVRQRRLASTNFSNFSVVEILLV